MTPPDITGASPPRGRRVIDASMWVVTAILLVRDVLVQFAGEVHTIDLEIYRAAAVAQLDGSFFYGAGFGALGLPFTYPPFALLAMLPLGVMSFPVAEVVWYGVSFGCLVVSLRICLRAVDVRPTWALASLLAAGTLFLHPYEATIRFGQINMILLLLVLADAFGRSDRIRGVRTGIAGAIKLTPLAFIPWFLAVRDRGAAIRAAATFLACTAAAWLILPSDSARYWFQRVIEPGRMGTLDDPINQSLNGTLHRVMGDGAVWLVWVTLALGTMALGYLVARRLADRGMRLASLCAVAIAALLASPVSWPHHWVWVAPAAIGCWPTRREQPWLWRASIALVLVTALSSQHLRVGSLIAEAYVLVAVIWLAAAAAVVRPGARSSQEQPLVLPQLPHT